MRKFLFLTMFSTVLAFGAFAQDEIVIADYEVNSIYPDRTGGWNLNNIKEGIDNPVVDDVNGSTKVASFKRTTQYSDAVQIFNFHEAISLGMYPIVKMKVLPEVAVSKKVSISLEDINGLSQSVEVTLPENSNSSWTDLVFDFSEKALNTPISFIKSATIFFDNGNLEDMDSYYYFDDIRFCGPQLEVDPGALFTLFQEQFGGNRWNNPETYDGYQSHHGTIEYHYSLGWGSGFAALQKYYNLEDSARVSWPFWDGTEGMIELESSSVHSDYSYLSIYEISISGYSNLSFTYDLMWKGDPTDYTQTLSISYSIDGVTWIDVPTSTPDLLPQSTYSWGTGITHPFTNAAGSILQIRIENNSAAVCFVDNIKVTGTAAYVTSVDISVTDGISSIDIDGGTLQINSTVLPTAANKNLYWTVIESDSTGRANISSTGLLTAEKNGTVSVIGRALDLWGTVADTMDFVLTNQIFPVTTINITGADTIKTDNGKEVYLIEVLPVDADTLTYTLSMVDSSGNISPNAFIELDGTLTAVKNGYVIINAVADDYMGVIGQKTVVLENQDFIAVESIELIGSTTIAINGGTLQVSSTVLPDDADNRNLKWSITNETGSATVSEDGLVQAVSNGSVTVIGSAMDGSGITGSLQITITNQENGIASKEVQKLHLFPNPVQQQLHIKNRENTAMVEIINSLGKVVLTAKLAQNQNLDVQNLKSGMYIIRAISDEVVYQATFIKN